MMKKRLQIFGKGISGRYKELTKTVKAIKKGIRLIGVDEYDAYEMGIEMNASETRRYLNAKENFLAVVITAVFITLLVAALLNSNWLAGPAE